MSSERQLINKKTPWWGEHVYRYDYVLKNTNRGLVILDLACGTGYGSNMLCDNSNNIVIGGDISDESLHIANREFKKVNLTFEKIDGTCISYPDNYFDVITSFETIEHLTDYKKLINEFYRVLKPGGKLYLSTPNSLITSPNGVIKNKFHVQEFNSKELQIILSGSFAKINLKGQNYTRYINKNSIRHSIAKMVEAFFYLRGVRKIPIKIQDFIMRILINKNQYPEISDFNLFEDITKINSSFVLFAECEK